MVMQQARSATFRILIVLHSVVAVLVVLNLVSSGRHCRELHPDAKPMLSCRVAHAVSVTAVRSLALAQASGPASRVARPPCTGGCLS